MVTDPLFYRLFASSPETFFILLGMSVDAAREMASRYQYDALEFKETSHRLDGVFQPKEAGLPLYFLEVQFYYLPSVFADLLVKAYTYLKQHDPAQEFRGVVLFAERNLEPKSLAPYQPLLDAGMIQRFYLDEMPELADSPLGIAVLLLIRQSEPEAPLKARNLIARALREISDAASQTNLIELITTVIIYRLPHLTREEIQAMLQVHDIRETRVYQDAKAEGKVEGIAEGKAEGRAEGKAEGVAEGIAKEQARRLDSVSKMAALNFTAEQIADLLKLDLDVVLRELGRCHS